MCVHYGTTAISNLILNNCSKWPQSQLWLRLSRRKAAYPTLFIMYIFFNGFQSGHLWWQLTYVDCFMFSFVWQLIINRLTAEQRYQIFEFYFQNQWSFVKVHRVPHPFNGAHYRTSIQTLSRSFAPNSVFWTSGENTYGGRWSQCNRRPELFDSSPCAGVTPLPIEIVEDHSQRFGPQGAQNSAGFGSEANRPSFCVVQILKRDQQFYRKILGEAHLCLGGVVNKQNCHI